MSTKTTSRNARIATAVALALLALASVGPMASAEEPDGDDDGTTMVGPCAGVNIWGMPPGVAVDPMDCIPPGP